MAFLVMTKIIAYSSSIHNNLINILFYVIYAYLFILLIMFKFYLLSILVIIIVI